MKRAIIAILFFVFLAPFAQAAEHPLDRYTGYYQLAPRLVATITRDGDHLAAQLTRQPKIELIDEGGGNFTFKGIAARVRFSSGADATVTGIVIEQNGREIAAPRIDAATAQQLQSPAPQGARSWAMLGGTSLQLLTNSGTDYWPTFSPDGKTVIFARTIDAEHWQLFKIAAAGGTETLLAASPLPVSATRPNWSANTNTIAFTATTEDGHDEIWTIKANGIGAHVVLGEGLSPHIFYASWEPDGKSLVVLTTQPQAIQRVNLVTGKAEILTDPAQILPGMASVSPDGKQIVVAGQKAAGQGYDQSQNTLWLIDAAGTLRPLETPALHGRAPVWSPDGRWIAFESDRGSADGRYAVFLVRPDGNGLVQVTDYFINANHPVFSKDMRQMVVTVGAGEKTRIAIVGLPERL